MYMYVYRYRYICIYITIRAVVQLPAHLARSLTPTHRPSRVYSESGFLFCQRSVLLLAEPWLLSINRLVSNLVAVAASSAVGRSNLSVTFITKTEPAGRPSLFTTTYNKNTKKTTPALASSLSFGTQLCTAFTLKTLRGPRPKTKTAWLSDGPGRHLFYGSLDFSSGMGWG